MSLDYFKTTFLNYVGDFNKSSIDLEFRFTVYDEEFEDSVLVTNEFTLTVSGQPNFCADVDPVATFVECERLGLVPCPNERIFVSKGRLTFPHFGATSK